MDMLTDALAPQGEDLVAALERLLAAARGDSGAAGTGAGGTGAGGTGAGPAATGVGGGGLSESIDHLDDGELKEFLRDAELVGRLVDAARVVGAGEVDHRSRASLGAERMSHRHGCRTASELVERVTLVSSRTARARMKEARPLRGAVSLAGERLPGAFPLVREAVEAGALGADAAQAITQPLGEALSHGADVGEVWRAERELVTTAVTGRGREDEGTAPGGRQWSGASGMPADEVAVMARVWALYLDPDGAQPDEKEGMRRRGVTLGHLRGGTVPLRGELLPEVAAQFQRLLDAHLNPRAGRGPDGDVGGDPAAAAGATVDEGDPSRSAAVSDADLRTYAKRRHDALAGILTTVAGCEATPGLGGAPPTLLVSVTPDQLEDPRGVAFLHGVHDPDRTAISAGVARQVACAGAVQRVAVDDHGRIVELGTPQRVFTPHQRRAITLRDGECVVPGCHVPSTWCEIHHVTEHHAGGATHTDNGVLLCWFHHRTLDSAGWQIDMRLGHPWVRPPAWIDPDRSWTRAGGSTHRQWEQRRARRGGTAGGDGFRVDRSPSHAGGSGRRAGPAAPTQPVRPDGREGSGSVRAVPAPPAPPDPVQGTELGSGGRGPRARRVLSDRYGSSPPAPGGPTSTGTGTNGTGGAGTGAGNAPGPPGDGLPGAGGRDSRRKIPPDGDAEPP